MNIVCLIGRLTKNADIRYTQTNNKMVASFTLAVNRKFAKEGEQQADFISIIAWNKTAEFVNKYFKKGMQVSIVGRIETRSWEDQNGQKRYATEVVAEEVGFADSKKETENTQTTNTTTTIEDDDLPF